MIFQEIKFRKTNLQIKNLQKRSTEREYIGKSHNNKAQSIIDIEKIITIATIVIIVIIAGLLMINVRMINAEIAKKQQTISHQTQIAEEVLRFHVIANSDSEEDQALKLKVKETVLEIIRPKLAAAKTTAEAEKIIFNNMEEIELTADKVIEAEGYSYKSKGVLGKTTFPIKQYGDMVFPAGEYEAFRILLGEAEGKNWWCVMFPTLCYVDETYDVITEENKEQFKEILTEEEYNSLLSAEKQKEMPEDKKVFYKMKSVIWLNKVIDYFGK